MQLQNWGCRPKVRLPFNPENTTPCSTQHQGWHWHLQGPHSIFLLRAPLLRKGRDSLRLSVDCSRLSGQCDTQRKRADGKIPVSQTPKTPGCLPAASHHPLVDSLSRTYFPVCDILPFPLSTSLWAVRPTQGQLDLLKEWVAKSQDWKHSGHCAGATSLGLANFQLYALTFVWSIDMEILAQQEFQCAMQTFLSLDL